MRFFILTTLGLLILATVTLLPAYAGLAQARYQRDSLAAKNANDEALTVAYQRLIAAIPTDPVLAKRLAIRQFGFPPRSERIMPTAVEEPLTCRSDLVTTILQTLPDRPYRGIFLAAEFLQIRVVRTILLLAATATLLAGMIYSPAAWRKAPRAEGIS